MIKRMIIMLLLVGLVLGGIFGFKSFGHKMMMKYMAEMNNPVQTVSTMVAGTDVWQKSLRAVGTFRAIKGTDIAAETSGLVEKIHFESGQDVEEGAILMEMSSASDSARLRSLEAALQLAETNYARDQKLAKVQAISRAALDTSAATVTSARAAVEEQRAELNKKIVRAPFSGSLGIKAVDIGQYINPGAKIVTLQQLDPLYLDFYIPQRSLGDLKVGQKIKAKIENMGETLVEGEISAIDAEVQDATRNILVRATFQNCDKSLVPGMFAVATIAIGEAQKILTLPQTAISYNPYGNTVFVVEKAEDKDGNPTDVARQVFVTTGETRGDQIAILSGLKEGEVVVTTGQLKIRNGSLLNINNSVMPSNDADPKPQDK